MVRRFHRERVGSDCCPGVFVKQRGKCHAGKAAAGSCEEIPA